APRGGQADLRAALRAGGRLRRARRLAGGARVLGSWVTTVSGELEQGVRSRGHVADVDPPEQERLAEAPVRRAFHREAGGEAARGRGRGPLDVDGVGRPVGVAE